MVKAPTSPVREKVRFVTIMIIAIFTLVWLPLLAIVLGGYGGVLHPIGDSLGVFRLEAAAAFFVVSGLLGLLGGGRVAAIGIVICLIAAGPILWAMRAGVPGTGLVLYQKNLLYSNRQQAEVVADIRAVDPDFVTLQEMTAPNTQIAEALLSDLPHQAICPFEAVGALAILSRWPIEEVRCDPEAYRGLAAARIATPDGPIWVASVHLHWPWPSRQPAQVDRIVPQLAMLDGPVVMAGDFNMVSWSSVVGRMSGAVDGAVLGPSMVTRVGRFLRLRIDHVVAPLGTSGSIERRGLIGSDHHGLVARIGPLK